MFLVVMLVCIDDRFTTSTVVSRGEHAAYEFIKPILEEHIYCRKIMNKHFNKNLVMAEEKENSFQEINVGFVKKLLIMMMKRLEIIITLLVNLEEQHIGIVT